MKRPLNPTDADIKDFLHTMSLGFPDAEAGELVSKQLLDVMVEVTGVSRHMNDILSLTPTLTLYRQNRAPQLDMFTLVPFRTVSTPSGFGLGHLEGGSGVWTSCVLKRGKL